MRIAKVGLALLVVAASAVVSGQQPQQPPPPRPPIDLSALTLPPGFAISLFAEGVPSAREMAVSPKGTVFVGALNQRNVYALVDANRDHKVDEIKRIAMPAGLSQPSGIALRNGSLYVATTTKILRYDDIENHLDAPPEPAVVYEGLPNKGGHTWRFIAFGPDGLLYAGIGSPCNVCENPDEPRLASIVRMKADGTGLEVFATGVRNTVGFDWHPQTREIWFTDNGRDNLGDDVPNDELNNAPKPGMDFGFPYCNQGTLKDPDFGDKKACSATTAPAGLMGPHVASIGMRFYSGSMFPASYRNAIFIAQHGSWNRSQPIGYRVMVAHVDGPNHKMITLEPFVDGFLKGVRGTPSAGRATGDASARPADVLVMPDGSLLISDDQGGRIFRVTYGK
jgi:glucose/arabinose dehydrogenase